MYPPPGNRGQIVHMLEHSEFVQRFQDTQVERGAANPAPGKSQADAINRGTANPRLSSRAGR